MRGSNVIGGGGETYTTSGRECAIDVEEADCVLDRAVFERWIDACCFGHVDSIEK